MSTEGKKISHIYLLSEMYKVVVSLLWEWIGFAVRGEHLLFREEKGISSDFPYGSSSRNTNPGSTTG